MLVEFGTTLALVGHSERRRYNAETSDVVARKALAALNAGVTPVICVGETLAEREAVPGRTLVGDQLHACRDVLRKAKGAAIVAYMNQCGQLGPARRREPAEAQAMHAFIRTIACSGCRCRATSIL